MFRFFVAGVATVTLFASGAFLGLMNQGEPPAPHVRLADRASNQEAPGSTLEGLNALAPAFQYVRAVQDARVHDYLAAVAAEQNVTAEAQQFAEEEVSPASAQTEPSSSAVSYGDGRWDAQAVCETGGNWQMQGSSYSGGLGFANGTWSAYGGGEFASNAGQASREQQIVVAKRIQSQPPATADGTCHGGW